MTPQPPGFMLRFLRWFCREDYLEEIEGDLIELFEERSHDNPAIAKRSFIWDVIKSFRWRNLKQIRLVHRNYPTMLKHTFLITFRNFKKHKNFFFINVTGLSLGLACVLLIYLWVQDELAVDRFHTKGSRIYQVMEQLDFGDHIFTSFETAGIFADMLKADYPEIEYIARVGPSSWYDFNNTNLTIGQKNIRASVQYVGTDYFNVFSFDLLAGDANQVLRDKNSIVISTDLARRLFNSVDVIGREIVVKHEETYLVSGVFEQVPINSTIQFDAALSFEILEEQHPWVKNWDLGPLTYLTLKEDTNPTQFNDKLRGFIKEKSNNDGRILFAKPFEDQYLYGNYDKNGHQLGGRITYVRTISYIALFILLIACINFMNLSTAKASRKLKEIGVKKSIGARRTDLILQYLGESTLLAFIALVIGIVILQLFLPSFNQIIGKELSLFQSPFILLVALLGALFTGLIAGSYPAFYLSRLKTLDVLKGRLTASLAETWTRKGLVGFQFIISTVLIFSVFIMYRQINYIQNQNIGYGNENVIYFNIEGKVKESLDSYLEQVRNTVGVLEASSTSHKLLGRSWWIGGVQWDGRPKNDQTTFEVASIDTDFIETMNMQLAEGRSFDKKHPTDTSKVLFNETAIAAMGLQGAVLGEKVQVLGNEKQIIGILKDFHFESIHEQIKPMVFTFDPPSFRYVIVKLIAGQETETIAKLQKSYATFNPGFDLEFNFLDQDYQAQYERERQISTLSGYFAGMGILISCLGLFGLVAFVAERRTKEIGIRKVLGASILGIVRLLSVDFTLIVIVSICLALPISFLVTNYWLNTFAYHIQLSWWNFLLVGFFALFMVWITVGYQTIKAARSNPAKSLKVD